MTALLVFLGGGLGALLRYGLVLIVRPHWPAFPVGTLAVNLIGCAAIGALAGRLHPALSAAPDSRAWAFLAAGVLGGFTTFSSFALEFTQLLRDGRPVAAVSYAVLSNALGVALAAGAMALAAPRGG